MTWGRLDDDFWNHRKTEALLDGPDALENLAAIGLWTLGLSYTNARGRPYFTTKEAVILTGGAPAELLERLADRLREVGLLERDDERSKREADPISASILLRSRGQANTFHDWQNYRSKNEAKQFAGAQGGKKSGESRRAKREANAKQTRSSHEANAKQTRTPDPVPDPVPDSSYRRSENSKTSRAEPARSSTVRVVAKSLEAPKVVTTPKAGPTTALATRPDSSAAGPRARFEGQAHTLTASEVQKRLLGRPIASDASGKTTWPLQASATQIARLAALGPISETELAYAIATVEAKPRPNLGFLASVIERDRLEAATASRNGSPPPTRDRFAGMTRKGRELALANQAAIESGGDMFAGAL